MSKIEKLRRRMQGRPSDFAWDELVQLMAGFGFRLHTGQGSSRKFLHETTQAVLMMHEPHPGSILKAYQVRAALQFLKSEGFLP